jgi:uncharacterized protein YuzE
VEAIKIMEKKDKINWDYDEEADVLYISMGSPKPSMSADIGDGVVVRYDEKKNEVTGLTLTGLKSRLLKNIENKS